MNERLKQAKVMVHMILAIKNELICLYMKIRLEVLIEAFMEAKNDN